MAELFAKCPFADVALPLDIGGAQLAAIHLDHLALIQPRQGAQGAQGELAERMKQAHGLTLPKPGRSAGRAGGRLLWFGLDQWLLMGLPPDPALAEVAALSDQSDGWAALRLEGPAAQDVLARLVPIDLRRGQFKRGHTARTPLQHMACSLTRLGADAFQIMVFRSMAETLYHELQTAMRNVAARDC